ncbi:hypothetical protein [Streptomyces sp. NBC_01538]|uniref:hypothetical protein n=1 Tax=Streptomyces sp. NBC_01538 TaxID=2903897 RepID=UPI003868A750
MAPAEGLTEADQAAVDTWPPELRARLRDRALTRQIMSWHRDDPGGYGMRNALRNRR